MTGDSQPLHPPAVPGGGDTTVDGAIILLDPHGMVVFWSVAAEKITGYSAANIVGHPFGAVCRDFLGTDFAKWEFGRDVPVVMSCAGNTGRPVMIALTPLIDGGGVPAGFAVRLADLESSAHGGLAFGESKTGLPVFAGASTAAPALLIDPDDSRILDMNETTPAALSCSESELRGLILASALGPVHSAGDEGEAGPAVCTLVDAEGCKKVYEFSAVPVRWDGRDLALVVLHDVSFWADIRSELARSNRELTRLARHDHLTGLFNRPMFLDTLDLANSRLARLGGRLGVLYVDLDGFKPVNDRYGHHTGDRVLIEVAGRLRRAVRTSDVVARLGGDEFGAILENLRAPEDALRIARHIVETIAVPFDVDGTQISISASIGAVVAGHKQPDASAMVGQADRMMYEAKRRGPGQIALGHADPDVESP